MSDRIVEVIAGVLQDARGRILLARRTEGRDLAGLWEFPGGKREPGETPEAALARELYEELGIDAEIGEPLIRVPHRYPHKRLLLDVRRVASWRGTPKGVESQALAWVPRGKLASYAMPSADRPVVAALLQPDRLLVTPAPDDDAAWLAALQRALDAGIRRVQLRAATGIDPGRWRALVAQATVQCRSADAEVLVNGDIDLARDLGIGLHLPQSQLMALDARPLPAASTLAASCHDAASLQRAERLGCDFAVLGPVAATASHPGAPGIGWAAFAALRERAGLPIYAIGGLGEADIDAARGHGAQGIAAIRALWPPAGVVAFPTGTKLD
ncbi:Nudix family hydrolase [Cognatiluteimonas telluris]|jgi:8-oxo-dGTP diphosphatase|uniref:Nudix family hydrolase n=1 Tax=Cognatiluteimonas telluris TaxID=1104775 RepID=UPI0014077762|nr:Nudix family hydrolase [Lysobacter telluris]